MSPIVVIARAEFDQPARPSEQYCEIWQAAKGLRLGRNSAIVRINVIAPTATRKMSTLERIFPQHGSEQGLSFCVAFLPGKAIHSSLIR